MTMQEAFDTALRGVLGQGGPSVRKGGRGCAYRGAKMRKCGVGWIVEDKTARRMDNAEYNEIKCFPDVADELGLPMDFLEGMQDAHDVAHRVGRSSQTDNFLAEFTANMRGVAVRFGLNMDALQ